MSDELDNEKHNRKSKIKEEATSIVTDGFLGADEWKRSKVAYVTGISGLVSGARKAGSIGYGSVKRTTWAAKRLFSKDQAQPLPTTSDDPARRFQVAMQVYDRTEEDVEQITRASRTHAFTWMFVLLALTIWAFYQMPFGIQGASLRHWLFPFFAHLFVIPMTMRSLFWNWQLRTKRLGSWSEFKSDSSAWLPGLSVSAKAIAGLFVVTSAYILGAPQAAIAEGVDLGALGSIDPSALPSISGGALDFLSATDSSHLFYQLLQVLAPVGPVEPGVRLSPWAGPLSNAFGTFNTILLTVSAAMLGWQTVAGMIATAHEGKMLGQKWHQIWAPVRVTAGVGTLVPIAGGYSAIQLVVLQIALWGSGMADMVWHTYIESFRNTDYLTELVEGKTPGERRDYGAALHEFTDSEDAQEIVLGIMRKQVCLGGIEQIANNASKILAGRDSTWDRDKDIAALTPAEWAKFSPTFSMIGQNMASGITHDGKDGTISMLEVATGQPRYQIGFDDGKTSFVRDVDYPPASEGTKAVFEKKGSPVVLWNYGPCGAIKLNFMDIKALQLKLKEVNPERHAEEADGWFVDSEIDKDAVSVDLATHKQAYDLVMSTSKRVGNLITTRVNPNISTVSDLVVMATTGDDVNDIPPGHFIDMMNDKTNPVASLGEAYQAYVDIMQTERYSADESIYSMLEMTNSFDAYIDKSQEMGWASAGSLYMVIARMQEINHNIPTTNLKAMGKWPMPVETAAEETKTMWTEMSERYAKFEEASLNAIAPTTPSNLQDSFAKDLNNSQNIEDGETWAWVQEKVAVASAWVGDLVFDLTLNMEPDPYFALVELVEFGQLIIKIAGVLLVMSLAAQLIFGVSGIVAGKIAGKSFEGLVNGIAWMLKMGGLIILALGVVHAYIIPMIPYIMFNFFVVGMLILIAEALVAAPIWAFMHVRMDGQEFVDQVQRPGYMIAFNLFLRPTLAIFGLILSFSVFSASIWFLNATFEIAARGAMAEGSTIIGGVVMLMIMTYMHYQLAIRSFKMINELPDRVVRWFGQGGENLGEADEANRTTALFVGQAEDRLGKAGAGFSAKKENTGDEESATPDKPDKPGGPKPGGGSKGI